MRIDKEQIKLATTAFIITLILRIGILLPLWKLVNAPALYTMYLLATFLNFIIRFYDPFNQIIIESILSFIWLYYLSGKYLDYKLGKITKKSIKQRWINILTKDIPKKLMWFLPIAIITIIPVIPLAQIMMYFIFQYPITFVRDVLLIPIPTTIDTILIVIIEYVGISWAVQKD